MCKLYDPCGLGAWSPPSQSNRLAVGKGSALCTLCQETSLLSHYNCIERFHQNPAAVHRYRIAVEGVVATKHCTLELSFLRLSEALENRDLPTWKA